MSAQTGDDLANEIGVNLPYLRRYARALTGNQKRGDTYAAATLEAILADPGQYDSAAGAKVALFRVFHAIWDSAGASFGPSDDLDEPAAEARRHLAKLTRNTREALLLRTVEEFSTDDIGQIMGVPGSEAADLVKIAYAEMADHISGRVLIIEDEAIISMDLEAIVTGMGHRVIGIARTEDSAVALAAGEDCDLILSDIHLADNSSGIDAVNRILERHGDRPVIFITAFPERLLTGQGPEPAFLISKPYTEAQVTSAISQAMFFSSTKTLTA